MKTPLTYYGGKQSLLRTLLPLIPEHTTYTESFVGGGALFWAKEPSVVEVINDTNREVINFYEVIQNEFIELEKLIRISLHSRSLHSDALVIYNNPHMFSRMKRAWAVWTLASQSFFGKFNAGWGYEKKKSDHTKAVARKRESFSLDYAIRLQAVQIECTDALRVIRSRDSTSAMHYCDPPYYNAQCGHYNGYNEDDFESLLKTLKGVEGKFLLSSYASDILKDFTRSNHWATIKLNQAVRVSSGNGTSGKRKIEVLTTNYDINAMV